MLIDGKGSSLVQAAQSRRATPAVQAREYTPLPSFLHRPAAPGIGTPGCTQNSSHYGHGLVALASDGVHFETHSAFNAEYGDVGWFKCQAARIREVDGYRFVMNHGTWGAVAGPDDPAESIPGSRGCPNATKQCLRFLKSKDAVTCKPPRYCWHLGCIF